MEIIDKVFSRFSTNDSSFSFHHTIQSRPLNSQFPFHKHGNYELFVFLKGKGTYLIEGQRYELHPFDMLIINDKEVHKLQIDESKPYERIIINFSKVFLEQLKSDGYDLFSALDKRRPGFGNKINGEYVNKSGIMRCLNEIEKYIKQIRPETTIMIKCMLLEILVAVNRSNDNSEDSDKNMSIYENSKANEIIEFINNNLTEVITLDILSQKFYLNKYHICHLFKDATGFSVNQYVTYKRVIKADHLLANGSSATNACELSGFNDYSNFYKTYKKYMGKSPRQAMLV